MIQRRKKASLEDWHPADITAALRKVGWSFNQLGYHHGYTCKSSLARALHQPWPKAERLIAEALGVKPQVIWPSRYNTNGTTNRPRGRLPLKPSHHKVTPQPAAGNPQKRRAA